MNFEVPDDVSMSVSVVRAVTDFEDESVESLPPLFESVDPDVLDEFGRLVNDDAVQFDGQLSFTYSNSRVIVENGEKITIQPLPSEASD